MKKLKPKKSGSKPQESVLIDFHPEFENFLDRILTYNPNTGKRDNHITPLDKSSKSRPQTPG